MKPRMPPAEGVEGGAERESKHYRILYTSSNKPGNVQYNTRIIALISFFVSLALLYYKNYEIMATMSLCHQGVLKVLVGYPGSGISMLLGAVKSSLSSMVLRKESA